MTENTEDQRDSISTSFGFFNEIGIIEQLARTRLEKVLPDGMKMPHFGVLNHLVRLGKKESPAQLASAFQVTRPTMTNTIQRLEKKDYISVEPDPHDGRAKRVLITPAGRDAHSQAIEAVGPLLRKIMQDLGSDFFHAATPLLTKARIYLDENRD